MNTLDYVREVALLCLINLCAEVELQTLREHMDACIQLGREPNFDTELVIDEPWRIYYAWNLFQLERKCLTVQFKNATSLIVDRVYNDMHEYLKQQPIWEAATLLVTMTSHQEMLLFAAQGPAGYFLGVPNVIRDGKSLLPIKNNLEPMRFQLKLFDSNKYLVMMDCKAGVTTLMAREENKETVVDFAATLKFNGEGSPACTD